MSKASRQSLVLLAIVNGVFLTAAECEEAAACMATIEYGKDISTRLIHAYPETGDAGKNMRWMTERLHQADYCLNRRVPYTLVQLVSIGQMIMADLSGMIRDRRKLDMLEPVIEALDGLSDQLDPEGSRFADYKAADLTLRELYGILEM